MKLPGSLRALLQGGSGVAFAVLLPRALSLGVQWLLTLSSGPAALAAFVNITARGSLVTSLVAAGLAPTFAHRTRALTSKSGRALAGGALSILASLAFACTFAYEMTLGHRSLDGVVASIFSACSLFGTVAATAWSIWQLEGRYLQTLAVLLVLSPGASVLAAIAGMPAFAALATGLAMAVPSLRMVRPTRAARAARYAIGLVQRAVPLSVSNFATSVVYPTALSAGLAVLGDHIVGQQAFYWSLVAVLSIASQSFAARAISGASGVANEAERTAAALRAWARSAVALGLLAMVIYVVFTVPIPGIPKTGAAREAITPSMLISGVAPLLTDPLSFYFCGQKSRRALALGSAACGAVVYACILLVPSPLLRSLGVFGPSALVGVLRLAFVVDAPGRRVARTCLVALLGGYAVALLLAHGAAGAGR